MSKPDRVPSRSIEVTSSSPAPRSTARSAQATASRPGRLAAALDHDLPGARRRSPRASIATTTAWRPNRPAQRAIERRVGDGRGVQRDLVGAGPQDVAHLVDAPHAAADGERDERPARRPLDDVEERAAALRGGGDVEEDELVGALGGVALGELGRVALVDEVDEAGALDDAAVGDVEAGDHPAAEHQARPHEIDEVGQQPQAVVAAPLGVELDAEQRAARDRRHERARRARSWRGRAPRRRRPAGARRTSGRSRSRRRRRSRRTAGAGASARPGSSRCAAGSGRPRGGPSGPARTPERRRAVLVAALEQQLEAEADAEERPVGGDPAADRAGQAAPREPRHRRRRGADARDDRAASAPSQVLRPSRATSTSAPTVGSAWSMLTRLPAP